MMLLRLVPSHTNISFLKFRQICLFLSVALILATFILMWVRGLNLGIDFLGGSLLEVKTNPEVTIEQLREKLGGLGVGDVSIQEFGDDHEVLIRLQKQEGDEKTQLLAVNKIQDSLKSEVVEFRRVEFVGPTVGAELIKSAIFATLASILSIMVYVWFRFEWQYGVAAVISLVHDVVGTIGLFLITGMEFNLTTVAALLTIAGYSINDTVVVFDRIRENLPKYKKMPLLDLLNKSINDTLSRTLLTSLTTEIALLALVIWGGEVLRGFSIALMFGVLIGTYSSLYIAIPILNIFKPNRNPEALES